MQPNWLAQRSYLTPDRIGLRFGEKEWTFHALFQIAEKVARKLATHQLVAGERVAILAPSNAELIHVIYGCMHARLEIVFLNNRLSPYELAYQIEDADVKMVLAGDGAAEKVADFPTLSFAELFASDETMVAFAAEWDEQQTISIMYTSGTTGFPKGVRQTLQNHTYSAMGSALNLGLAEQDVWLCAVPIFHISGFSILMRSLLYGMTVCLYEKFDEASCAHEIANGTVTKMSIVGVALERMLTYMEQHQLVAHLNFTTILAGGGPVPVSYLERAQALHLRVSQTYGMTETSSQTATLSNEDAMRKAGSAGKPLFFNQIRIEKSDPSSREGEICIRGPHVTPGYIGRFSDKASLEDGWLKTGDIGYIDEEGFLYVIDRRADLIISGGENIYPAEIEAVLVAHPSVQDAGVCAVEDEKWGQVPAAFVVLKEECDVSVLQELCYQRLARYKVPKVFKSVPSLPRNGANKLMRRKLKEWL